MSAKKVIVTGGAGFVGRNTIAPLLDRGFTVHSVGRGDLHFDLIHLSRRYPDRFHHDSVDLLDTTAAASYLKEMRATHLLHLAWDTRHGLFWNSPENQLWLEASRSLIRSFIENGGARLVGAGTCAEYGWGPEPLLEHVSPLTPSTPYGRAKLALRNFLQQPDISTRVSCAWGRIFHLFGPYENEKRLVSSACLALIRGEPFKATSGEQIRDFSSAIDVGEAFVALLDSDITGDINIASGEEWSVGSILNELGAITGRPDLVKLGGLANQPSDPPLITARTARLRDEVGFRSRESVRTRLAETVEWWRAHGLRPTR
jgi:nucleoside-diphosphate-sugar epimerase